MHRMDEISRRLFNGYLFRNSSLLAEALAHRSYSSEHGLKYDNQRLEFLGDAVIQLIVTECLYAKYADRDEGIMSEMRSALVRQETLAKFAREIGIQDFIRLGKGEERTGGRERESLLSDAFEAVIGAYYLDAGLQETTNYLVVLLEKLCPDPENILLMLNPKGLLQEFTQKHMRKKPDYTTENIEGPDHERIFTVSVSVSGTVLSKASASSKKAAEVAAAGEALQKLKDENAEDTDAQIPS
ncbi:MAG: ribonuclease III [Lentisphaerae bacterium GWF2_52_8]|nr:MAG: ribonuclease III [Lentisphaerae bacterium GWF2_52_8]